MDSLSTKRGIALRMLPATSFSFSHSLISTCCLPTNTATQRGNPYLDQVLEQLDVLRDDGRAVGLHEGPEAVRRLVLGQVGLGRGLRHPLDLLVLEGVEVRQGGRLFRLYLGDPDHLGEILLFNLLVDMPMQILFNSNSFVLLITSLF